MSETDDVYAQLQRYEQARSERHRRTREHVIFTGTPPSRYYNPLIVTPNGPPAPIEEP